MDRAFISIVSFSLLAAGVWAAAVADDKYGEPIQGLQIAATLDSEYGPGSPIELTISVKNSTDAVLDASQSATLKMFQFNVQCGGKPVALTAWGKQRIDSAGESSYHGMKLAAGEVLTYKILLSRVFDLSAEGKYTVSVNWRTHLGIAKSRDAEFIVNDEHVTTQPTTRATD